MSVKAHEQKRNLQVINGVSGQLLLFLFLPTFLSILAQFGNVINGGLGKW